MIAGRAGNVLESIGHVRLGAEIEFHISIDGEAVEAFFTDAPPFPVGFHQSLIDPKTTAFADGALNRGEPGFDSLDSGVRHEGCVVRGD